VGYGDRRFMAGLLPNSNAVSAAGFDGTLPRRAPTPAFARRPNNSIMGACSIMASHNPQVAVPVSQGEAFNGESVPQGARIKGVCYWKLNTTSLAS